MTHFDLAKMPGDFIGKEVVAEEMTVLQQNEEGIREVEKRLGYI